MHFPLLLSTVLLFDILYMVPQQVGAFGMRSSGAMHDQVASAGSVDHVYDEPMVLLVGSTRSTMAHSRTGIQAKYINTWVGQGESIRAIEDKVFVTGKKTPYLKIFKHDNGRLREIILGEVIRENLLEYLSLGPPMKRFDCGAFVTYLLAMKRSIYDVPIDASRVSFLSDNSNVPPGEVVFISKTRTPSPAKISHFAISLGDGLYLSKFGIGGAVRVTDLAEMRHFYSGRAVYRHLPSSELRAFASIKS